TLQASILSIETVKNLLGINYNPINPAYIFALKGDEAQPSSWCAEAMSKLMYSRHYRFYRGEPLSRTLIDLLLCDRLLCLDDNNQKGWWKAGYVAGRADYALGYKGKKYPDAILIIAEAKKERCCPETILQTLCYLAGLQDARKKAGKLNVDLFGMMADTNEYRFVLLDCERRAFISEPLLWATRSSQIVAFVDHILRSAISSSPHTIPVKTKNRRITNYDDHLDETFQRGVGTSARMEGPGREEDPDE
ncbi:MAG: hypothetical protein M1839_003234, partial [Geoglossum umbratile]